jgi:antitoxin component YwqK of YwqJK toxin-antitoxin module
MLDKKPRNDYGQRHGRWVLHWHNGQVMFDFNYINRVASGLFTQYDSSGLIEQQTYYAR